MKTNYEYFLKRRNLTTKTIIESNKIKDYKELLILLERLKVSPPPFEEVSQYFIKEEGKKNETKKNKNLDTKNAVPKARDVSKKKGVKKSSRNIPSKKSSTSTEKSD